MLIADFHWLVRRSGTRVAGSLILGLLIAVTIAALGAWLFAPVAGWIAAASAYLISTWGVLGRFNAGQTSQHATLEDSTRFVAHVLLLCASVASFAAIAIILLEAKSATGAGKVELVALALLTIVLSWFVVHTVFTLRYAHLYYRGEPGGVDFNQPEPPTYGDFAYLAFTLGTTFQVSDTNIRNHALRMSALAHSLLSYLFGVVVLATTVNLISGLL